MFPSKKYPVPADIALLYDFVNSLDARHYTEQGALHTPGDVLATPAQLQDWMQRKRLPDSKRRPSAREHARVLAMRRALRSYLKLAPDERAAGRTEAAQLNTTMADFPMAIALALDGAVTLHPRSAGGIAGLGNVLAEFHRLAQGGRLQRLKMCASDECGWIFYDRSKPGNRRWCSSTVCGNREKTRSYRNRQKQTRSDGR